MPDTSPTPILRGLCLALAAAVTFQLFYLGSQPVAAHLLAPPWDAVAHFAVYSALTALLWTATAGRMPLAVLTAVIAIGGLDELNQAGLPGRVADAADFLLDAGAAIFTCASLLLLDALRGPAGNAWARPPGQH